MFNDNNQKYPSKISYSKIDSIDYYLEEINEELTKCSVLKNIKILQKYRNEFMVKPTNLIFSKYKLQFQGVDEAVAIIRGLEFVLEGYQKSDERGYAL